MEEQDGYEAATHAGRHSSAMGECLAIENPAMMEGQTIMYDGGSAEITEAEIQIQLTEEEELILKKHPKFTLLENLKLEDLELDFELGYGKHRYEMGRDNAGGHSSAMGEYQTMPELPSQPEGGRGDTATCTGGVICVEEQDGYEAATQLWESAWLWKAQP